MWRPGLQLFYNGHKHTMFRTCAVRFGSCATGRNPDGSIQGTVYLTGGNAGEPSLFLRWSHDALLIDLCASAARDLMVYCWRAGFAVCFLHASEVDEKCTGQQSIR